MPPTRGGNARWWKKCYRGRKVSIHAPHAGGQPPGTCPLPGLPRFNTCPPRGGATPQQDAVVYSITFQYMPPTRGGNRAGRPLPALVSVSIHAPHAGGQRRHIPGAGRPNAVSIHAPHAGGQRSLFRYPRGRCKFQYMPPTRGGNTTRRRRWRGFSSFNTCPPRGGATQRLQFHPNPRRVSIHAPHAGGQRNQS